MAVVSSTVSKKNILKHPHNILCLDFPNYAIKFICIRYLAIMEVKHGSTKNKSNIPSIHVTRAQQEM